ncbi:antibiotic biosynthesis monooxygenase family protein [Methanolobus halotolerans]|uniref:antibiotic biosynthesis monooxygenase family protein n=1 Tax=Methanolobus halotolerans TaxID=2052935 RepID=UPI001436CB0B|nr:antibiotic biosynthesis monooxygenase family protein [Methanolobus halotolerans]
MDEEAIYSVGVWSVKTGKEETFLRTWMDFANWTMQSQKGACNVIMLQDLEQKNRFISLGPWDNLESLQAWRETLEFKTAFVKFKDLCNEIEPHTMKKVITIPSPLVQKE